MAKAHEAFEASGRDPLRNPRFFPVDASGMWYWWAMFHLIGMVLVPIHYCIQLHRNKLGIFKEVVGNPAFPLAVMFWEVGVFRYPFKVSPAQQLRRARQWGALVFSTALSCFAGTGKVCEEREHAPQYQKYQGPFVKWSFTTAMVSDYLGLDGAVFHPGAVQQSGVTAKFTGGFYATVSNSVPIGARNLNPNYGNEIDVAAGWSGSIRGNTIDASITYLDVVPLHTSPRGDVIQFSERVSRTLPLGKRSTIGPYVWLRQAIPVRGPTPVGGWFIHGGAMFSRELGKTVSGSVGAEVVRDSGAFGFKPGYIGRALANLTWKFVQHVSIQLPFVSASTPLSHTGDGRTTQISFGVGFSFSQ